MTLPDYLTQSGLTASAFAALVGVNVSTVTRWARGERWPRPEQIIRVEQVTGGQVTAQDFLPPAAPAAAATEAVAP